MAFDKKSTMYSKSGNIGSSEDLDAYGVWVKSEPQDITAGFAEAMGFGGGATPYEADFDTDMGSVDTGFDIGGFDTGFDDIGVSGFSDITGDIPEMDDFTVTGFDDVITVETDQEEVLDEKSSKLLNKIADELTSIRTELSTLKQEFTDIRTDNISDRKKETEQEDCFFADDGDETIALTGEEMDNFFTSANFSGEEALAYDSLRDEDMAALRKLSLENEAAMINESSMDTIDELSDDEIIIDFNDLGLDFDNGESSDVLNTQEIDPLDNIDELKGLRLEGADPMTPAPDDASYLEEDPFVFSESPIGYDDISFEDSLTPDLENNPLEINLDDFSGLTSLELDEGFSTENDFSPIDLTGVMGEPQFSTDSMEDMGFLMDIPAGVDELAQEYPVIDDISLDLNAFETGADPDVGDNSFAEVIPEGFETSAEEEPVSFDDDLDAFTEEDISLAGEDFSIADQIETASINIDDPLIGGETISSGMRNELKDVLSYMDHLLESLPEDKIKEFARSEHFETYKKLFKELGLV